MSGDGETTRAGRPLRALRPEGPDNEDALALWPAMTEVARMGDACDVCDGPGPLDPGGVGLLGGGCCARCWREHAAELRRAAAETLAEAEWAERAAERAGWAARWSAAWGHVGAWAGTHLSRGAQ